MNSEALVRKARGYTQPRRASVADCFVDAQSELKMARQQIDYWTSRKVAAELTADATSRAIVLGQSYE